MDAAETMVSETIQELEPNGLTVGAKKTHWTSSRRNEKWLSASGRAGNVVRGPELCWIHGEFGRKRDIRNRVLPGSRKSNAWEHVTLS